MKQFHRLLFIATIILLSSCSPKISTSISKTYPPLAYKEDVVVIGLNQPEPEDAEVLGLVKIGDNGFSTNCGYNAVIFDAKQEARKAGGNALKLIEHKQPDIISTCDRITAKILRIENIDNFKTDTSNKIADTDLFKVIPGEKALIILENGREVECILKSEDDTNVYVCIYRKSNKVDTHISKEKIKSIILPKQKTNLDNDYQALRIAINGGYSYVLAEVSEAVPDDFKDYVNELKSGYHFGGDFTYYFSQPLGIGFRYYLFKTSNSMNDIYVEDASGHKTFGVMSDDLTISYIGPMFSLRYLSPYNKNTFFTNFSLGYMSYSNKRVVVYNYKLTGSTFGVALDIGYDIGLSRNFSLGLQLSLNAGALVKYELDDGTTTKKIELEKDEYESLNRIDLSVGLRFGK